MTITSAQTISRGGQPTNVAERNAAKPPPKVYEIREPPFKGYQPPQPDGYEQSKANPGSSAIVIDNGMEYLCLGLPSRGMLTSPLFFSLRRITQC